MQVWEVAAQLTGLAASVAILKGIEASHVPIAVLPAWVSAQAAHVILRYYSLRTLQFTFLNQKRACAAVHAHVRGQPLPGKHHALPCAGCRCNELETVQECWQSSARVIVVLQRLFSIAAAPTKVMQTNTAGVSDMLQLVLNWPCSMHPLHRLNELWLLSPKCQ